MVRSRPLAVLTAIGFAGLAQAGCSSDPSQGPVTLGDPTANPSTSGTETGDPTTTSSTTEASETGETSGGTKFDMAPMPDYDPRPPGEQCKVIDDMNAIGDCDESAPPDAFEPEVQWSWTGPEGNTEVFAPALVANLTDDDENGEIDLCDVPDVVVVAGKYPTEAKLYVLDGATGALHFEIPYFVAFTIAPALGDIDGDGLVEIVAANGPPFSGPARLVAFEHDGTPKWSGDTSWNHPQGAAIALADLDADGDVEIIVKDMVYDHEGALLWQAPPPVGPAPFNTATTAADLDDDGDLEVVIGQSAYHHDGSEYYFNATVKPGFPQVADYDDDGLPEILVNNYFGLTMLEHDGTTKFYEERPEGTWPSMRPSAVHDFDGDGLAEIAVSSNDVYSVFDPEPATLWSALIDDGSGSSAGTAFDFDGNGLAEAMYADEQQLYVFDAEGNALLTVARSARTLTEYPTVADVDNDGSAEIIVVSDAGFDNNQTAPSVQVIRDVEDRWIQARRIWNQHTYHVTNVREDGTIPQFEQPSWTELNTFRTNAQIEGGEICKPDPVG